MMKARVKAVNTSAPPPMNNTVPREKTIKIDRGMIEKVNKIERNRVGRGWEDAERLM